jgi:hypothetical protein
MVLVRSAFWLTLAYFAIGPRFDYAQSVDDLSTQALVAGQQLVLDKVNTARCETLECAGAKLLVSASLGNGVATGSNVIEPAHPALQTVIPRPLPRLERTG